jgi:hypothetical protein
LAVPALARNVSAPLAVPRSTLKLVMGEPPSLVEDQLSLATAPLRITVSAGAPGTVAPAGGSLMEKSVRPPTCRMMVETSS